MDVGKGGRLPALASPSQATLGPEDSTQHWHWRTFILLQSARSLRSRRHR